MGFLFGELGAKRKRRPKRFRTDEELFEWAAAVLASERPLGDDELPPRRVRDCFYDDGLPLLPRRRNQSAPVVQLRPSPKPLLKRRRVYLDDQEAAILRFSDYPEGCCRQTLEESVRQAFRESIAGWRPADQKP
jgi:hypothetical protein